MKKKLILKVGVILFSISLIGCNDSVENEGWDYTYEYISQGIASKIVPYEESSAYEINNIANMIEENKDGILKLVNKNNSINRSFVPSSLVLPNVLKQGQNLTVSSEIKDPLENMFKAASEAGHTLYLKSGYRSYDTQKSIYYSKPESQRGVLSAKPGESEHQLGLAVDITTKNVNMKLVQSFGQTSAGKWLNENAHKFGFILRYTKGDESRTGYVYEPWHFRYVGEDIAKLVYENNLILEDLFPNK
ncbi:MAG: M15 family metallopeptidase, partial [Clostridium sp.]